MTGLTLGVRLPMAGPVATPKRLIEAAQEAERLGYSMLITLDHIHNSFEKGRYIPPGFGEYGDPDNTMEPTQFESVAGMAFLAGVTKNMDLLWSVVTLGLRDPILLAKQMSTIDALSGGRCILGVGVGNVTDREEFGMLGRSFPSYDERWRMADKYISAMKALWSEPRATFHGKYVNFEECVLYPKPIRQRIPIWVGTRILSDESPRTQFAIRHADGWVLPHLLMPEDVRSCAKTS